MSVRRIKAGSTDVSITLRIVDSADGTPETGVVFNTAGIDLWYRRDLAASVDITEATLAALTTAHTDGGFIHINDGWYRLDLPDAAVATGVAGVQIGGTVTGMVVLAPYIELPVNTEEDVYTRIGAPAGASIAADLVVIEGQTDDIGVAGAGLTAINLPDQTMNITGNITGNLSGSVGSVTGAVGSVTGAVGSVTGNVGGNVVGSVGSVAGAVASVTGNVGGNVTGSVGSLAAQAKADVNAEVDTAISDAALATAANLATVAGYLDTEIVAIKDKTDQLTFTTANQVDATAVTVSDKTGYRLSATGVDDVLRTALTESYAADGAAGTLSQILFAIQQFLQEKSISGTTLTVNKLDGSTSAMTFTLSDASNPTSVTRAT